MGRKVQYSDQFWTSPDGLRLHFRDYAGPKGKAPILCIPGLTRNARDFEALAERIGGERRVICVDLRGRGESEHAKDSASYTPQTYLADLEALLAAQKIKHVIAIGSSLGGLLTMKLAAAKPGRVIAAVLNDVGPVVEAAGLVRIKGFVGRSNGWPTWVHAARALAEQQGDVYPDFELLDWLALAKRLHRLSSQGRIVPDYDNAIADPLRSLAPQEATDLWPAWDAMGTAPTLVVRGGLSDILSAATAKEMVKRRPTAKLVTLARVGHAPTLDEPAARRAIDALLKSCQK